VNAEGLGHVPHEDSRLLTQLDGPQLELRAVASDSLGTRFSHHDLSSQLRVSTIPEQAPSPLERWVRRHNWARGTTATRSPGARRHDQGLVLASERTRPSSACSMLKDTRRSVMAWASRATEE
jgi:hypothetical protein